MNECWKLSFLSINGHVFRRMSHHRHLSFMSDTKTISNCDVQFSSDYNFIYTFIRLIHAAISWLRPCLLPKKKWRSDPRALWKWKPYAKESPLWISPIIGYQAIGLFYLGPCKSARGGRSLRYPSTTCVERIGCIIHHVELDITVTKRLRILVITNNLFYVTPPTQNKHYHLIRTLQVWQMDCREANAISSNWDVCDCMQQVLCSMSVEL